MRRLVPAVIAAIAVAFTSSALVAPAQAATSNLGRTTVGAEGENLNAGYQVSRLVHIPADGVLRSASFYVDGGVGGASGTENLRAHIYGGGPSKPVEVLGSSGTKSVNAGAPGSWLSFAFPTPVAVDGGWDVWLTLQGTGSTVARVYRGGTATGAWGEAPNLSSPPDPYKVGAVATTRNYSAFTVFDDAPASSPTPTPTPTPTATPTADPNALPVGDLPGWRQTLAEDFTTNAAAGQVGNVYSNVGDYGEHPDYSPQNASVSGGQLHLGLSGDKGSVAVIGPPASLWGWKYGKVTVRFRMPTGGINSGAAMMLWPSSDVWGDGEVDYPEGSFTDQLHMYQHGVGCGSQCGANIASVDTGASWRDWHTASTERGPDGMRYFLDGKQIAYVTTHVPINNHRFTTQLAPKDGTTDTGSLDFDWVAMYAKA